MAYTQSTVNPSQWQRSEVDLAAQLPLYSGQQWKVVALGFEPGPDGDGTALHAVAASTQGHRVSFVYDPQLGTWTPQWNADGGILRNEVGLQGLPQDPDRPTLKLDHAIELSCANTEGELCMRHGARGDWRRLTQPDGSHLKHIHKLVTDPSGLTDGKRVFALQCPPGETGRVVELTLNGRVKRLPADPAHYGWSAGAPPLPCAESLAAGFGHVMVNASGESLDRIVDFAVTQQGDVWHVTQGGDVLFTKCLEPRTGSWPVEFADWLVHAEPMRLPRAFIRQTRPDGTSQDVPAEVKQITVAADSGRVLALARMWNDNGDASLHLLEFSHPQTPLTWPDALPATGSNEPPRWTPIEIGPKPVALPADARLSVNLFGTPMLETRAGTSDKQGASRRYRVLPLEKGRAMLHDVTLCSEDPRGDLDQAQGLRGPGPYMNDTSKSFFGQSWVNRHILDKLKKAYKADAARGVAKQVASGVLHTLSRPLTLGPGIVVKGLKRLRQDLFTGRHELKTEYTEVHAALKSARGLAAPLFSSAEEAQIMAGVPLAADANYQPPAHLSVPVIQDAAATLADKALERAVTSLEHIAITAGVLEPDLKTEHQPGKFRQIRRKVTQWVNQAGDSRDVLPDVVAYCSQLRALKDTEGLAGLFSPQEHEHLERLFERVNLLQRHGVPLWDDKRGKGFNFAAYHGSFPIQAAALVRSLQHFRDAVRLRTLGDTRSLPVLPTQPPDSGEDPLGATAADLARIQTDTVAALKVRDQSFEDDPSIELASFGFSGWAAYEAFAEAIHDLRAHTTDQDKFLKPGSLTYENWIKSLSIQDAASLSKEELRAVMAAKLNETGISMDQRSVLFNFISAEAGIGIFPSNSVIGTLLSWLTSGVGGYGTVGRSTGIGLKSTTDSSDGNNPAPLAAIFVRSQYAGVAAQFDLGFADRNVFRWASAYGRGAVSLDSNVLRGAVALVNREDFPAFIRDLLDPAVPARAVLRNNGARSSSKGAIGLNQSEVSASASLAAGGGINASNPRVPLRQPPMTFGANQTLLGTQLRTSVHKRITDLRLRLGVAGRTSVANERTGGYGSRADFSIAARANMDAVKFDTDHEQNLRMAGLGIDAAGMRVGVNNVTDYKRTSDWVAATPVSKAEWLDLSLRATEIPGLAVPVGLDPSSGPEGRAQMRTWLKDWVQRLEAMEMAVLSERENWPALWTGYLAKQGPGAFTDLAALRRDAAKMNEVKGVAFMHRAREALIRDRMAERGLSMLQSSARIELNVPNTHVLTGKVQSNHGHQKLGSVILQINEAREKIPGMKMAMTAFSQIPGYNEARCVFNLNRRLVADLNEMLLADDLGAGQPLTYRDVEAVLAATPVPYQPTALVAKNRETDTKSVSLWLGLSFRKASEFYKERALAELRYIYGFGDRLLRVDFLPSGQRALSQLTQGLRAFASKGERLVPPLPAK